MFDQYAVIASDLPAGIRVTDKLPLIHRVKWKMGFNFNYTLAAVNASFIIRF